MHLMKKVTKGMYRDSLSDSKLHFLSGVILRRSILLEGYHLLIYNKMDARVIWAEINYTVHVALTKQPVN